MTLVGDQRRIIRNQTPIIAHRVERYRHGFFLSSFLPSARPRCVPKHLQRPKCINSNDPNLPPFIRLHMVLAAC